MTALDALADLIRAEFVEEYRADLSTIVGARSDLEIAALVEQVVRNELGAEIRRPLFASKSVGLVFGVELDSGERVVLKFFHPSQPMAELSAMQRCVQLVIERAFPAPSPRSRLFRVDGGPTGGFYAYVDGEMRDGHQPEVRRELARSLAELVGLLETTDPKDLRLAPTRGRELWPASHRSFLSLKDDESASWIDEVGRRAQTVTLATELPLLPAHLDWGVKNVRFRDDKICVVYDWDSLFAASEPETVGRAAAQFTAQWDFPGRPTPTPDEARAFVEEYEAARGRTFSEEKRAVAAASAHYLVAQVARAEFAAGASEGDNYLALLRSCERVPLL